MKWGQVEEVAQLCQSTETCVDRLICCLVLALCLSRRKKNTYSVMTRRNGHQKVKFYLGLNLNRLILITLKLFITQKWSGAKTPLPFSSLFHGHTSFGATSVAGRSALPMPHDVTWHANILGYRARRLTLSLLDVFFRIFNDH